MTVDALRRLGLDASADEKAIRKAYARELKLIDQETQIMAFQALREVYETALGLRQAAAPAPAPPSVDNEAQEAYDWLVAAVAVISGGRRIADETIWVGDLIEQLAEQQPVGLDAGWQLEAAIGRLLAEGWKPGHEALLLAASHYFGWAEDGNWPSPRVADAWFERLYLHHGHATLRAPLLRVVRDLRQTHEPDMGKLRRDHAYLEHLATHFPNLTAVIVDMRMLARWRELAAPLGVARDVSWVPPANEEDESLPWSIFRAILILLTFLLWISLYK